VNFPLSSNFAYRSRSARALLASVLALSGLVYFVSPARSTSLLGTTFTNMTNSYDANVWTVGGDDSLDPVYSPGHDQPLAHMVADSVGSSTGRLQLTDTSTFTARGYALDNQALPTSGGLDIYFNTSLYGSGGSAQADGLVFYLKSGTDTQIGPGSLGTSGGSMGYSDTNIGGAGLSGALLGIGFDAYGNFYQKPFSGNDCTSNEDQNNVGISETPSAPGYQSKKHLVIRGPKGSDRTHGYCRVATTNDETVDYSSVAPGGNSQRNVGVSLKSGTAANIFSQAGAALRIKIDPQDLSGGANGTGYVYVATVGTSDWSSITPLTTFQLPSALSTSQSFKFGFVAGTGGGSVNTQIWGLSIQSLRAVSVCTPTITSDTNTLTTLVAFKTTTVCSYTFPSGVTTATALIVGGGGGGGGDAAGGGGGGGVETDTVTAGTDPWIVSVGTGGAGGAGGVIGDSGGSTSLSNGTVSFLVQGGSGGHPCFYAAPNCTDGAGGLGGTNSRSQSSASGGHGGYYLSAHSGPTAGGNGTSSSISGTAQQYGAGGGGGNGGNCPAGSTAGGSTGGGNGFICTPSTEATVGTIWLGAGGGGGGNAGAAGGNGVIYLIYATPIPHTVTFLGNGSTSGTMTTQTATIASALTTNSYLRTGYTFSRWNSASDGSGTSYAEGATYSFSGDVSLYAQWTANSSGGGYYRAPNPIITITVPPEPTSPVIVEAPKATAPGGVKAPQRKISVSQSPTKTIIAIAPRPLEMKPLISLGGSDIAIKGLNANEYIRVTILDKNGKSLVVTSNSDSELSKIVNNNPKSALSIEITPTLNSKLKKGARVGVNGAKTSDRVRVTVK